MEQVKVKKPEIHKSWLEVLEEEFEKPYFLQIKEKLLLEKQQGAQIFPPGKLIFNAFNLTPFSDVKVVILGQDPYHGPGQAHGLCFSVPPTVSKLPPSLQNIYKELNADLGFSPCVHGNLEGWAKQGVLLMNALLTVRANSPGSHQQLGWEVFTDAIIKKLSEKRSGIVFLLWGRFAQNKAALIDASIHHILKAAHPSPFSAASGFFGCRHFSKTNDLLVAQGLEPVNWDLSVDPAV